MKIITLIKILFAFIFLLSAGIFQPVFAGRTINVTTQTQYAAALNSAIAGDTIIVGNNNYNGFKLTGKNGTPSERIIIKSLKPFGAVISAGQLELLNCSYLTFENFYFTTPSTIKLTGSQHLRFTRNKFQLEEGTLTSLKWIIIQGDNSNHNRIDHNEFGPKTKAGNFITIAGGEANKNQSSQYDLIDHNTFRNRTPRLVNDGEAIRAGESTVSQSSGFTVIEYNYFLECDADPEIVSIKTNDNIVRYNTFRKSQGTLSARQGNRTSFYGNFFLGENKAGTGGVRLYSDGHKVYNNYFEGLTGTGFDAAVAIHNGDADDSQLPGADQSRHYRPTNITIAFNTLVGNVHNMEFGFTNNGNYSRPPRNLTVANNIVVGNTNPLYRIISAPITSTFAGNIAFPTGSAMVGMTATSAQIRTVNPLFFTENGLQKLSANSPAINAAVLSFPYILDDLEGQLRDFNKDVGADESGGVAVPRFPLTAANAGLNSATFSISGRAVNASNQPIGGVTVTLTGTKTVSTTTDLAGYFNFTDLRAGENYRLTPVKSNFTFAPNSTVISNISADSNITLIGTTPANSASKTIAGRVTGNNLFAAQTYISLIDETGNARHTRTNQFGFFRFPNVTAGQNIVLDARTKNKFFAPQIIAVNDELSDVNLTPQF